MIILEIFSKLILKYFKKTNYFLNGDTGKKESPKVVPKLKLIPKNETKGVITSRKYIPSSSKKSTGTGRKQSKFAKKKFRDYDSPLQNRFCSTRRRDLDYEVCSIDCKSYRRGRRCRETIYQKKCGCKEMRRAKRTGVMKYKVSIELIYLLDCVIFKNYNVANDI